MSDDIDKPQDGMPTGRWDDGAGATTPNRLDINTGIGVGQYGGAVGEFARTFADSRQQGMCNTSPEQRARMQAKYDRLWQEQQDKRYRNTLIEKAALAILPRWTLLSNIEEMKLLWQEAAKFVDARPEEFKHD
jgi:hypothetical protein